MWETSQTFAQVSTHVSLSSVHRPAPGADARGRVERVSQPYNIGAALPDQSKGPASLPKPVREMYKTRANTRNISPKYSSCQINPQWVSVLLTFLAPPRCMENPLRLDLHQPHPTLLFAAESWRSGSLPTLCKLAWTWWPLVT